MYLQAFPAKFIPFKASHPYVQQLLPLTIIIYEVTDFREESLSFSCARHWCCQEWKSLLNSVYSPLFCAYSIAYIGGEIFGFVFNFIYGWSTGFMNSLLVREEVCLILFISFMSAEILAQSNFFFLTNRWSCWSSYGPGDVRHRIYYSSERPPQLHVGYLTREDHAWYCSRHRTHHVRQTRGGWHTDWHPHPGDWSHPPVERDGHHRHGILRDQ